jgi:hypothetical protein
VRSLNESLIWLDMLRRMHAAPSGSLEPLLDERDQLCRIIAANIKTASTEKR